MDSDAMFVNIGTAQVVEKRRSHIRIAGRATIRLMLVSDNKESHCL
jgi:hypothetical protein